MIRVKVDKADPTDLYEQVAAEIRRAIAEGEAKPGERLPPSSLERFGRSGALPQRNTEHLALPLRRLGRGPL